MTEEANQVYRKPSDGVMYRNKANLLEALGRDISWLHNRLYTMGRKMGLGHHSTEDAIQDFYIALCTRIVRRYDGVIPKNFSFSEDSPQRDDLMKYASTSFGNLVKDYLRRGKRRAIERLEAEVSNTYSEEAFSLAESLEDSDICKSDESLMNEERKRKMEKYLTKLPQNLREIVALAYYSKYTYEQISAFLEIPVGTVKSRLHYALTSLADIVKEDKDLELLRL